MAKKRMSEKQRLFGKLLCKSENQTEAYLQAYPGSTRVSARANSANLLKRKPEILEYARSIADKNGLTIDKATKKLAEKLDAKKYIATNNGLEEVDDNPSQIKASEIALKVHGALKVDGSVEHNTINIQNNQAIIVDKLGDRLDKVLAMFEGVRSASGSKGGSVNIIQPNDSKANSVDAPQPSHSKGESVKDAEYTVNDTE